MGSFAAGAGTQFVVTSTTSPSGGSTVPGPFTVTAGTATANTPALNVTQTWNNAAVTFTGWQFNVTDTASNAASLLMDLQVGGSSRASINKNGTITGRSGAATTPGIALSDSTGLGLSHMSGIGGMGFTDQGFTRAAVNGVNGEFGVGSSGSYNFGSSTNAPANNFDVRLFRDAANTLAQRNGTNAQTFRVYNTFTDASNYERLSVDWTSNVAYIRPQNAGTGSARLFVPVTGSTTVASLPAAATAGAGARAFVTDATATTFLSTVAGGGANKVPVVSDGTNWLIG